MWGDAPLLVLLGSDHEDFRLQVIRLLIAGAAEPQAVGVHRE